jgi:hypothetical protein
MHLCAAARSFVKLHRPLPQALYGHGRIVSDWNFAAMLAMDLAEQSKKLLLFQPPRFAGAAPLVNFQTRFVK